MPPTASFLSSAVPPSLLHPTFNPASTSNLPKTLLSPADIEVSITAYENLLQTAKSYRNALVTLTENANAFGAALEECSRTKGVDEAAEGLSNVAGLQYLLANHQSVLSDTIYRSFEIPLRESLENFVTNTEQRREEYKNELLKKTKLLAKREKEHLALAHKKKRSLNLFREALADLTKLADDIEQLKSDYFYNALDYHSETWFRVAARSNIVCKAELALYAGVAQKADHLEWSLVGTPDPWAHDIRSGDELFSIVPPQDIMARPQSPSHDNTGGLFQSLLGTIHAQASPGPPQRAHGAEGWQNGKEVSEASFFSTGRDTKGLPAMKPSMSSAAVSAVFSSFIAGDDTDEHQFLTPKVKTEAPTSPFEDAEEDEDGVSVLESVTTAKLHLYSDRNETPSRPNSKRSNIAMTVKSDKGRSASSGTRGSRTSQLNPEVQGHPNAGQVAGYHDVLVQLDSPESDGIKHSEFADDLTRRIKAEDM